MQHIYRTAETFVGLQEVVGAKHNPKILEMFSASGHAWVQDDETPWCAAFVGSVLSLCNMPGTKKLNARSYLSWGSPVDLENAEKGDVVVLWRKDKSGPYGHVAFFDRIDGNKIYLLGGNQKNKVGINPYPIERVLGVRRAIKQRKSPASSTTIRASVAGAAGTATSMFSTISYTLSSLDPVVQYIVIITLAISLLSFGWIIRERLKKWAEGIR